MRELSEKPIRQWYFVKNGVVFDIKGGNPTEDPCGISYADKTKLTLPTVKVTESKGNKERTLYYDIFIEDGDTMDGKNFKKTIHPDEPIATGKTDETTTYNDYFYRMCLLYVKAYVMQHMTFEDEFFGDNKSLFPVPAWILKDNGYTIEGEQIDVGKDNIKALKTEIIQEAAYNAANAVVESYNKEMQAPASPKAITFKDKS